MSASTDPARDVAEQMAQAAEAWIDSLNHQERKQACWHAPGNSAESDEERVRWFYTPTDHGGLAMGEQRPAQQRRAMQLLHAGLSTAGYVTVSTIMGWENVLDLVEGYSAAWARERGRDPGLYYLRVFGDPRTDVVWGWRFGGHHVSLNYLLVDGRVRSTTPCFLGADPAGAPGLGGVRLRPLEQVEDLAGELVRSLSAEQLDLALLLPRAPTDIVGANRARIRPGDEMVPLTDVWRGRFADPELAAKLERVSAAAEDAAGLTPTDHTRLSLSADPKGISGEALSEVQRSLLDALVTTYTQRVPDGLAAAWDLDEVHLAWAGSLQPGRPHYYRLQAPRLLAEWDNTQRDANHAHSVWRDPANDFGLDLLAAHRGAAH